MTTAVADLSNGTPAAPKNALFAGLARLDTGKKVMLGLGVLALLAVMLAAFFMGRQAEYKVLFANLNDKDGGAVVAQLSTMGVPYQFSQGGNAILVPAQQVHDTRLRLASQGLPKGSVVGFELLDTTRLGMTQFQEKVSFQRGLEGELIRSITSLNSVQDARVHVALPNQSGFFREQQKPSASVLLNLFPGRSLDRQQIAGIVHLVASSVPEMDPKQVSVVDQEGNLLSGNPDGKDKDGFNSEQLQYVRQIEKNLSQRIMDLLEPVVGRENVRAQVTADLDFTVNEITAENFAPNQGEQPATVRSQQTVSSDAQTNTSNTGLLPPGAVANQAPANGQGPNAQATPGQNVFNGNNNGNGSQNTRREQVINYEVDRTLRVTRNTPGSVRRLTAAVVINHMAGKDAKGNPTTTPLPPEMINQINALVREAIGFSEQRGDSVNVLNAAFNRTVPEVVEVPLWKNPEVLELARGFAWPLGMVLLGLVLFMGMIRPAMKLVKTPAPVLTPVEPTPLLDAVIDDEPERPGLPQPKAAPTEPEVTAEMMRLEDAKRLAKDNPVAVANIVRGWVNGEPAAGTS